MEKVSFHLLSFPFIHLLKRLVFGASNSLYIYAYVAYVMNRRPTSHEAPECMRKILVDRKRFHLCSV